MLLHRKKEKPILSKINSSTIKNKRRPPLLHFIILNFSQLQKIELANLFKYRTKKKTMKLIIQQNLKTESLKEFKGAKQNPNTIKDENKCY